MNLEKFAVHKYPKEGKCQNSCFANGNHRVGTVPTMSLIDGGLPGVVFREVCLECKKWFKKGGFYARNQPRSLSQSPKKGGQP